MHNSYGHCAKNGIFTGSVDSSDGSLLSFDGSDE